jgi:4-amino-4-deoxy-L-arabinose transferase-like glycosyltransferase
MITPKSTSPSSTHQPSDRASNALVDRLTEGQMTLLLLLFGVALYVPCAGSYGLWDPWETHYAEVARQMVTRRDYISLWWPGSPIDGDYFWSKPVLTFWLLSFSMDLFGIGAGDQPGKLALTSAAEWAARIPMCLASLLAIFGVYLVTSRLRTRLAGVLAAVALATFPLFSLVARQAMTDMAFLGPMTLALALAVLGLFDDRDEELPRRFWRRLSWPHHPLFYLAVGLLALVTIPQLIVNSVDLRWRLFPGRARSPVLSGVVVMLPYIAGFVGFLYWSARTRFRAPLYFYLAAILCGLATLAKGIAGFGLPLIILFVYLLATWNWKLLKRHQLLHGVVVSLLACAVVAMPWHHAMLVRHGLPFWNELYGDNHWRRMISGRHGERGSFEYFLRQLGYALFPWIALVPAGLAWTVMRPFPLASGVGTAGGPRRNQAHHSELFWLGATWAGAAYAVVSMSMTKFHHYILPSLPGLAIVLACFLDDILAQKRRRLALVAALIGLPLLALVTFDLAATPRSAQHFIWLFSYDYVNTSGGRPWPPELQFTPHLLLAATAFGLGLLLLSWERAQTVSMAWLCLVSVAFTYFLLDVYMVKVTARWSHKPLIATYYRTRLSPGEPLVAWQHYWRGENFYTQNEIYSGPREERTVFLGDRNAEDLKAYLKRNRGKRMFFILERFRLETLRGLLPESSRGSLRVVDDGNTKFLLAEAQF